MNIETPKGKPGFELPTPAELARELGQIGPVRKAGESMVKSLGLEGILYVWVQRVLNSGGSNVYIITFDSRRPTTYLAVSRLKKSKSLIVNKVKPQGQEYIRKLPVMTPAMQLKYYTRAFPAGSLIFVHDLAGDYLRNTQVLGEGRGWRISVL